MEIENASSGSSEIRISLPVDVGAGVHPAVEHCCRESQPTCGDVSNVEEVCIGRRGVSPFLTTTTRREQVMRTAAGRGEGDAIGKQCREDLPAAPASVRRSVKPIVNVVGVRQEAEVLSVKRDG